MKPVARVNCGQFSPLIPWQTHLFEKCVNLCLHGDAWGLDRFLEQTPLVMLESLGEAYNINRSIGTSEIWEEFQAVLGSTWSKTTAAVAK